MGNRCKKEGCLNEALLGNKYCNYHEAKRQEKIKKINKGVKGLVTIALSVIVKEFGRDFFE